MNRIVRNTTLLMAIALISACGGKSESRQATTTKKEAEKVKVTTLQSERIAKQLELSSTLEGYETMNISPSITGHIEHIYVEVGSRVPLALEERERRAIRLALERHGGKRNLAAKELHISERTLYRKIKEYGIDI